VVASTSQLKPTQHASPQQKTSNTEAKQTPLRGAVQQPAHKPEKLTVTGDDILIEYIQRIVNMLEQVQDRKLPDPILSIFQKFVNHKVWQNKQQATIESGGLHKAVDFTKEKDGRKVLESLKTKMAEMKRRWQQINKSKLKKQQLK
jgi:hypothetical protein